MLEVASKIQSESAGVSASHDLDADWGGTAVAFDPTAMFAYKQLSDCRVHICMLQRNNESLQNCETHDIRGTAPHCMLHGTTDWV